MCGMMPRFVLRGLPAPEPTSRLALTWGDYRGRYVVGVALLIAGAALVSQTTAVTLSLGLLGSAVHLAGWAVQPGRPLARAAVAVPSLIFCWCTITGPKTMWLLAFVLPCWLLVSTPAAHGLLDARAAARPRPGARIHLLPRLRQDA